MAFNELRAIATFVRAAELGSLRQAALAQAITPQAASQALTQLESHLGIRLFLHEAQPGLATLQRALHGARRGHEEIAGPLRIAAPRATMLQVLWPVDDEFARRHPRVAPDVQLEDRIGNWVEDRVDVGFRAGTPPEAGVIARRLLPMQLLVCATPGYIARHGAPASIDDLARHRCSGFRQANTGKVVPWEFRVGSDIVAHAVPPAFTTNDVDLEARAVLSGEFVGQLLGVTAAPLVRAGKLVPLLTQHVSDHLALYLWYGSRVAQPARVRAFIDLAIERLADNPTLFLQPHELAPAPAARRARPRKR